MKGSWENKPVQVERNKKANGNVLKQMGVTKRLKVASLNSHLICVLCSGYYVEATAIVECLHTFCRSCIVKYLQSNNFCPICDVQIHEAKPWSSLRPDKTLQDLVYKLVPGLYQDEMKRRRQFYCRLGRDADIAEGEEGGFLPHGARFFSQDDSISLSLEYYSGQDEEDADHPKVNPKQINDKPKRYLQCPAAVTVRHLKKFLRMKYGIGVDSWVDIIYNDECLPENFSLIDVAYTFAWKRTSPMRFSYRIFSKAAVRTMKSQKNFQPSRTDEGEEKKSKHEPTLEQQMQSEYLGNFNLNPTNSDLCKTQNCTKTKSNCSNNNSNAVKTNNKSLKEKKEDRSRDCQQAAEETKEKVFQFSEDSNTSGTRVTCEKEESSNGNSEDSKESFFADKKRKPDTPVSNFEEETVDSFSAKKLLKSKHRWGERRKKVERSRGEKRRKSASHADTAEEAKRKSTVAKRRKTIAGDFGLHREIDVKTEEEISVGNDDEDMETLANLKNEALRKVFVTKEKPEGSAKRNGGEVRKRKRKKSKHHEGDEKKRKVEVIPTSPSIMSIAKDALKLKVKLTPSKPLILPPRESADSSSNEKSETNSDNSDTKAGEKKLVSDKERLLHLRAVRHKSVINKSLPTDYINTPPSLTISKVDSSEHHSVKTTLVETKPSLEITLVPTNSSNNSSSGSNKSSSSGSKSNNNNSNNSDSSNSNKSSDSSKNHSNSNKSSDSSKNHSNSNGNSNNNNDNGNINKNKINDNISKNKMNDNNSKSKMNDNISKSKMNDNISKSKMNDISKNKINDNTKNNNNDNINKKNSDENISKNNNNDNNTNNNNNSKNSHNDTPISKEKKEVIPEPSKEPQPKKVESSASERPSCRSEVVDNFGVLDLSEKSTRTKDTSSSLPPSKEASESTERSRKSTHQSIMQIAQNLVNRKLSPVLSKNNAKGGFDVGAESCMAAAAMRNLKTLSDTAVNILMAAQNNGFPSEPLKRSYSSISVTPQKLNATPNGAKLSKDCENGSGLKIPMFPMARERMHPIPPVPNLHEIYPRGRGKSIGMGRPPTPAIKPVQNQSVRQIPNPFVVLSRGGNQSEGTPTSPPAKAETSEDGDSKHKLDSVPPVQSIRIKTSVPKLDDLPEVISEKKSTDFKSLLVPKTVISTPKSVQNGSEGSAFGLKNGEEKKGVIKYTCSSNSSRRFESMAKNIESVAAGLTARAVSNAMIDAK